MSLTKISTSALYSPSLSSVSIYQSELYFSVNASKSITAPSTIELTDSILSLTFTKFNPQLKRSLFPADSLKAVRSFWKV